MGGWDDRDGEEAEGPDSANLAVPWEQEAYGGAPEDAPSRPRHDAFTPARKKAFLKILGKTGCVLDACRSVGVSSRTVYTHQEKDYEFARHCRLATDMAGTEIELMAWERGVVGVEEEVICGGKLVTRVRRSDSVLRLLLQGANRKKYGPRPGFSRKRLRAWERDEIEREVRHEIAQNPWTFDKAMTLMEEKLKHFGVEIRDDPPAASTRPGEDGDAPLSGSGREDGSGEGANGTAHLGDRGDSV